MLRLDRTFGVSLLSAALLAAASLAGCSSKNPDALTSANLDENLAVMDSNETVNDESNATAASVAPDSSAGVAATGEPAGNEAAIAAQANIDAAVNSLRQADADENEYCDAEMQATGENEDCDDN